MSTIVYLVGILAATLVLTPLAIVITKKKDELQSSVAQSIFTFHLYRCQQFSGGKECSREISSRMACNTGTPCRGRKILGSKDQAN